jgi:hypothetical protein
MTTKRCPECRETKSLSEFGNRSSTYDGKAPYCRPCLGNKVKSWKKANPDKVSAQAKADYEKHKPARKLAHSAWKLRNKGVWVGIVENYRRARGCQTPAWANRSAINEIYADAREFREHGLNVHVDHIIPLQGEFVSGLHVESNLTVKLAEHNASKGNRFHG